MGDHLLIVKSYLVANHGFMLDEEIDIDAAQSESSNNNDIIANAGVAKKPNRQSNEDSD